MENCLVTRLKASVDNNDLEYIDKLHINVHQVTSPNPTDFSLSILTTNPSVDKIITTGSGHFTNGDLTEDRGQEAPCDGTNQKICNGNYQVLFPLTGLRKFNAGSSIPTIGDNWQVKGLDYERLLRVNASTLETLMLPNVSDFYEAIKLYSGNITTIHFIDGDNEMHKRIAGMVDAPNRLTQTLSFGYNNGSDIYSTGSAIRKVKNIVPGVSFSVYNKAETELLYTAAKVNGHWTFTLNE